MSVGIIRLQKIECLIGENHTESKGRSGRILLGYPDSGCRHTRFPQYRGIEPRRPGTDDFDLAQADPV